MTRDGLTVVPNGIRIGPIDLCVVRAHPILSFASVHETTLDTHISPSRHKSHEHDTSHKVTVHTAAEGQTRAARPSRPLSLSPARACAFLVRTSLDESPCYTLASVTLHSSYMHSISGFRTRVGRRVALPGSTKEGGGGKYLSGKHFSVPLGSKPAASCTASAALRVDSPRVSSPWRPWFSLFSSSHSPCGTR